MDKAGIAFEFFPAVDGSKMASEFSDHYNPRGAFLRLGRELGPGELGCFASHRELWKVAVERNESLLVLEDDVDLVPNARDVIESAQAYLPTFGLVRLSGRKLAGRLMQALPHGYAIVRFPRRLVATGSYMIHPRAAKVLLNSTSHWVEPVDEHIDRFWVHGIDIVGVTPFPIWQRPESRADSTTAVDRNKLRGTAKIWREIVRMGDEFGRNTANIAAIPRLAGKPRYRPR